MSKDIKDNFSLQKTQQIFENKDSVCFKNTKENSETVIHFIKNNKDNFQAEVFDDLIIVKKIENG